MRKLPGEKLRTKVTSYATDGRDVHPKNRGVQAKGGSNKKKEEGGVSRRKNERERAV